MVRNGEAATVKDAIVQMEALRVYTNDSLADVSRRFVCVVPNLTPYWTSPLGTIKY